MARGNLSFAAAVRAWAGRTEEKMVEVFREAATELIETAGEAGPSVGATKRAIRKGLGSGGRGKNRKPIQGPPAPEGSGNMPVVTGFLRNSVVTALNAEIPPANRKNPSQDRAYPYAPGYEAVIMGAQIGDKISAGWTAEYAPFLEYGTAGFPGYHFVGKAVQQWQAIVDRAVARHRG